MADGISSNEQHIEDLKLRLNQAQADEFERVKAVSELSELELITAFVWNVSAEDYLASKNKIAAQRIAGSGRR